MPLTKGDRGEGETGTRARTPLSDARGNYEDFLRATWIRPEDMVRYEPYVDVVKIATRRHHDPVKVLDAYATNSYHGNLADLMDPAHQFPKGVDNDALGRSSVWPDVLNCREANNCRHCGKCRTLLAEVLAAIELLITLTEPG